LLRLILTNSEIRKLFSDFSLIGRDLLAKGTHKIADVIAPTDDELAHVDEPAPHGKFVSEGGREVGQETAPVLDVNVPGTDANVKQRPGKEDVVFGNERGADEVKARAQVGADEAKGKMREEAQETKEVITTEEGEKKKKGLIEKMKGVRVSTNGNEILTGTNFTV
jgi:hypothetical protein